jgi:ADP-ribose pyrophosphatase
MDISIKKTKEERIYQGFFNLRIDHFLDEKLKHHEYMCLESTADGVVVLAETDNHQYVIVQEHRYPVGKKILSLPGGRVNSFEPPLDAAKREFLEETGYTADTWDLLGEFYPFPSASDQKIWVFWARNLSKISLPHYDPLEIISYSLLELKDIFSLNPQQAKLDSTIPMALFLKSRSDFKN